MITLYGFGPVWGLRDLSPFVGKVDTYFRLAGIPYRLERFPFFGIGGAPKGKLPFIEHNGRRIADSSFILAHVQNTFGKGPDAALDDAQRARGHAIRRLVEEHLYWVLVQNRWRIDANWEAFMEAIFGDWRTDAEVAAVLPHVRAEVLGQLHGQGLGRHAVSEVWELGRSDIRALAGLLGDQSFSLGEQPTALDATVHTFLEHFQVGPGNPIADEIRAQAALVGYCERMRLRLNLGAEAAEAA
jgi:glutathione S-transferase